MHVLADGAGNGGADTVGTILVLLAIVAWASYRRRKGSGGTVTTGQRRLLIVLPIIAAVLIAAAVVLPNMGKSKPSKDRPTTTARLQIVSPEQGATVGPNIDLKLNLIGGKVVPPSNVGNGKKLPANEGHIHVRVDGNLYSMAYGLDQPIKDLKPGPHAVQAEFVALDHGQFKNPIVTSVLFTVGSSQ